MSSFIPLLIVSSNCRENVPESTCKIITDETSNIYTRLEQRFNQIASIANGFDTVFNAAQVSSFEMRVVADYS